MICLSFVFGSESEHPGRKEVQGHKDGGAGIVELCLEFPVGIHGIVRNRNGPHPPDAVVCDDDIRDVGQEQGHLVRRLHPQGKEGVGKAADGSLQFRVGHLLPHEEKCRPLRELRGRSGEDLRWGDVLEVDRPRDPGCVRPVPYAIIRFSGVVLRRPWLHPFFLSYGIRKLL